MLHSNLLNPCNINMDVVVGEYLLYHNHQNCLHVVDQSPHHIQQQYIQQLYVESIKAIFT